MIRRTLYMFIQTHEPRRLIVHVVALARVCTTLLFDEFRTHGTADGGTTKLVLVPNLDERQNTAGVILLYTEYHLAAPCVHQIKKQKYTLYEVLRISHDLCTAVPSYNLGIRPSFIYT